jgi:hypothetical protein
MSEPVHPRPRISILRIMALVAAVIVLGLLILPCLAPVGGPRPVAKVSMCRFNLSAIGIALRQYHDDCGCYPPAYIADEDGVPIHSWRVLLLPYIYHGTYGAYNFDEPWDGPGNILLAKTAPLDYRCPAAAGDRAAFTNYVAVTGAGTVFDGANTCRHEDITGDPAKKIMLVEIADSDIPWTAPRDLPIETLNLTINADRRGISSNHSGGVNVLFCAGSTVSFGGTHDRDCPRADFLSNATPPDQLKSMLQIRRKEP